MAQPHFLLVTFPAQGHINPTLQFAKRLLRIGARVTLVTCVSAHRRMAKLSCPDNLSCVTVSDGYDDGFRPGDDYVRYLEEFRRRGSETISDLIVRSTSEGKAFSCLVYSLVLPWAIEVAREHTLRTALLWIQPATVFDVYYYYFSGYGDVFSNCSDPSYVVELPGVTPLVRREIPSFLIPSNAHGFLLFLFQEQVETVKQETNPKILVNSFDALEPEALKAIDGFDLIGIGPLIPSAFLDEKDPKDTSFSDDLFQDSSCYIEWLNSKPKESVIYVSFGSISILSSEQMQQIARGLVNSGRPFLWVVREEQNAKDQENQDPEKMSGREELEEQGIIVPWCSQLEVLRHPSLGCFLTHCGWNSTLESLVSGVPVVAFPQWTDQGTNAKLIEDVWKTGVRVVANEEGIVEGGEFKRCLDLVMGGGERGEEMRMNARKWKDLARESVREGGGSDKNLKAFVEEIAC